MQTCGMKKKYLSISVKTYPSAGGQRDGSRVRLPRKENARSCHQCLFEENVGKTRKVWSTNFKCERFVTRDDNLLIKCANMTSICFIFPFTFFYVFCIFYLFGVDKRVSLAPTYPQLRLGNQTYVVL